MFYEDNMLYSNIDWNDIFVKVAGTIFILLPVFISIFVYLWAPEHSIYSLFGFLTEISLIAGIIADESDVQMHSIMTIFGLLVSLIEATIFSVNFGFQNGLVSFLIYWWVWLSLYSAGIEISLKTVEFSKLFGSLIITVGSIATLSWYWFSFFF
ncbi:MAG: hypothetical protein N3D75_00035 [Candidatus Aenigmarchaeota archaeon]|nr:hypothetical protein [Candidatus Aenigmarchaeota archaeon]